MSANPDLLAQYPPIQSFLKQIEPWIAAYRQSRLCFAAVLEGTEFVIVAARLRLGARADQLPKASISTAHLRVAEVLLATSTLGLTDFIGTALAGHSLPVGEHWVKFADRPDTAYTAYHDHPPEVDFEAARKNYLDCLRLCGVRKWDLLQGRHLELERELAPLGYQSLDELLAEWDLGLPHADATMIEIMAEPVVQLEPLCSVHNGKARISVKVPIELKREETTLTLMSSERGSASFRRSIQHAEVRWIKESRHWIGTLEIALSRPMILTCRALYAGSVHDRRELFDAAALPNRRRTLVELADPGLCRLQEGKTRNGNLCPLSGYGEIT